MVLAAGGSSDALSEAIRSYLQSALSVGSRTAGGSARCCSAACNKNCNKNHHNNNNCANNMRIEAQLHAAEGCLDDAARDFGSIVHSKPCVVVHPVCVEDISRVVSAICRLRAARSTSSILMSPAPASASSLQLQTAQNSYINGMAVSPRGNGHSLHGQAQALNGVVIDMQSLGSGTHEIGRSADGTFYVDVGAGELWIDVLEATLPHFLTPRSWPDYLYLSVGGTLQNAGVGGQTFRYGPQISNVMKLEIVTGTGDMKNCSPSCNPELYFAALGGLGQFGIITKARIVLEPAFEKVRWIRLVYWNFKDFRTDQEQLIHGTYFDYVEGFVVANCNDAISGWSQVPLPETAFFNHRLIPPSSGPVLYCLELAKYFNPADEPTLDQRLSGTLGALRYIKGLCFHVDVKYKDFLDRVHKEELKLRAAGVWEAPHPWLCLFVPGSQIETFDALIFRQTLSKGVGGPILIYPMLASKWDHRTSVVIPDEDIFYLVAILRSNMPHPQAPSLKSLMAENEDIIRMCKATKIHVKHYLPHFSKQSDWLDHFGPKWNHFRYLKTTWDPHGILTPGQGIFPSPYL